MWAYIQAKSDEYHPKEDWREAIVRDYDTKNPDYAKWRRLNPKTRKKQTAAKAAADGEAHAAAAAVPKTSAQLRPGPGDVGAPGSVAPWPPASAKESRRVGGCAIDASAFLSMLPALAPRACNQGKKAAAVCGLYARGQAMRVCRAA